MTPKKLFGLMIFSLLLQCLLFCLQADSTTLSPGTSELQRLQGTWEGARVGEDSGKITITITGNSLHFYRDKDFWFETTFTLPADTDPRQLHATIQRSEPDSADEVVVAIFKIEDGIFTIAEVSSDFDPSSFQSMEEVGRYELRKAQPTTKPPKQPS